MKDVIDENIREISPSGAKILIFIFLGIFCILHIDMIIQNNELFTNVMYLILVFIPGLIMFILALIIIMKLDKNKKKS